MIDDRATNRGTEASEDKLTSDEVERFVKFPLREARKESGRLVPIIGAGLTLPLGSPSWEHLVRTLASKYGLKIIEGEDAPQFLERLKGAIQEPTYINAIGHSLRLPDEGTTLALHALATSPVNWYVTTNLDFSVENAFSLAGRPFRARSVSYNDEQRNANPEDAPTLTKLHGSLERPKTWVMTTSEYNTFYGYEGTLARWWERLERIPLFIGFGVSDGVLKYHIRASGARALKPGYIIMHVRHIRAFEAELKRLLLQPIAVERYDKVCEVIDEIFRCDPIRVERIKLKEASLTKVRVASAVVDIPEESDIEKVENYLANALEPHTFGLLDEPPTATSRRKHGAKRSYFTLIDGCSRWIDHDLDRRRVVAHIIRGVTRYADVLFEELLPRLIIEPNALKALWPSIWSCLSPSLQPRLTGTLLSYLEDVSAQYDRLKVVANILAKELKVHPAQTIPPMMVDIPIHVGPQPPQMSKYVITNSQASELIRDDESIQELPPLRPFLVRRTHDVTRILESLARLDSRYTWRLPKSDEWMAAANQVDEVESRRIWPWGDEPPEYKVHAHLDFVGHGGVVAEHPVEVGLFPRGRSIGGGFVDLVGNVYEPVMQGQHWANIKSRMVDGQSLESFGVGLAGGSFTTSFRSREESEWKWISGIGSSRQTPNIGLRVVRQLDTI